MAIDGIDRDAIDLIGQHQYVGGASIAGDSVARIVQGKLNALRDNAEDGIKFVMALAPGMGIST